MPGKQRKDSFCAAGPGVPDARGFRVAGWRSAVPDARGFRVAGWECEAGRLGSRHKDGEPQRGGTKNRASIR